MSKDFLYSIKKIYDPIHGFIRFDDFERKLIDSFLFQRLHHIRQLGLSYIVYPGAQHTRFEHSLGVMDLATTMYKHLCKTVRPDLFHFIPRKGSLEYVYWKKVIRLAALCHDLGHLPFSHGVETKFLEEEGHEAMTMCIIESSSLEELWQRLDKTPAFQKPEGGSIREDVLKVAIGSEKLKKIDPSRQWRFNSWTKTLSQLITGDFFGADRIDYLLRDSRSTGVSYGLFDYKQLIEMLRILPNPKHTQNSEDDLGLGIDENGLESCEALLMARHFMHKRVYQYPPIKAYHFHVYRFMKNFFNRDFFKNLNNFSLTNDVTVLADLHKAANNPLAKGHEDAKKIIKRENPYKAFLLSSEISKDDLIDFQKKNRIHDEHIEWEIGGERESYDLSFPVAKQYFTICEAKECFKLLKNIPTMQGNWVYLSPEYERLFYDTFHESFIR